MDWSIPEECERWELEAEVPLLQSLARLVESKWPHIQCRPDFTEGVAFLDFFSGGIRTGRACVSAASPVGPHFSCSLGATDDEFDGYNMDAVASLVGHYHDALPGFET